MSTASDLRAAADRVERIDRAVEVVRFCRQVRDQAQNRAEVSGSRGALLELGRAQRQLDEAVDRLLEDASRR